MSTTYTRKTAALLALAGLGVGLVMLVILTGSSKPRVDWIARATAASRAYGYDQNCRWLTKTDIVCDGLSVNGNWEVAYHVSDGRLLPGRS